MGSLTVVPSLLLISTNLELGAGVLRPIWSFELFVMFPEVVLNATTLLQGEQCCYEGKYYLQIHIRHARENFPNTTLNCCELVAVFHSTAAWMMFIGMLYMKSCENCLCSRWNCQHSASFILLSSKFMVVPLRRRGILLWESLYAENVLSQYITNTSHP